MGIQVSHVDIGRCQHGRVVALAAVSDRNVPVMQKWLDDGLRVERVSLDWYQHHCDGLEDCVACSAPLGVIQT